LYTDDKTSYLVRGNFSIKLYPSYTTTSQVLDFTDSEVQIFTTPKAAKAAGFKSNFHWQINPKAKNYGRYDGSVKVEKQLSTFDRFPYRYNVQLDFSNGVQSKYFDGTVTATQAGKDLTIDGKYLVQTKNGMLKISFDPKDGEMWYVFESIVNE